MPTNLPGLFECDYYSTFNSNSSTDSLSDDNNDNDEVSTPLLRTCFNEDSDESSSEDELFPYYSKPPRPPKPTCKSTQ